MTTFAKSLKARADNMNSIERFLKDPEAPRNSLFSQSRLRFASPERIAPTTTRPPPHTVTRSDSASSTPSSASRHSDKNSISGREYTSSSRATSISERIPPWATLTLLQQLTMLPHTYGYDLPCEFLFIGCNLRFHPADFEAWISHSESHFINAPLPPTAICTFCDDDEAVFENHNDAFFNWRERMLHIGSHLQNFTPSDSMRPDFWVIDHMWTYGLISPEDYKHALKGSERPQCANTYPLDFETPEMLKKKEKNLQQPYDLVKEQRRMKRELKDGKVTYKSSTRPRKPYNTRINSTEK